MGTTESLLYDDPPAPQNAPELHPPRPVNGSPPIARKRVSDSSKGQEGPKRPLTRLSGVVVGGPKVGKRSLLQRLQGIDPYAPDANNEQVPAVVTIPYRPPTGMPTWNRIQLQVGRVGSNDALPMADFVVLLVRPTHENSLEDIQSHMLHVIRSYLDHLKYTPTNQVKETQNDEKDSMPKAPVCICVLVNFRDVIPEEAVAQVEELQKELERFLNGVLKQYSIPDDRLLVQFLSASLRNCYGLDRLHKFIYRTYLQKKREALEAQLRAVTNQIRNTDELDFVAYSEFCKQLNPPTTSSQSGSATTRPKNAQQIPARLNETPTNRPKSRRVENEPRGHFGSNEDPQHPAHHELPRSARNSNGQEVDPRKAGRRQLMPQSKKPVQVGKDALEAFLASDSSDDEPARKAKPKAKKKKAGKKATVDSSSDDDDDFFYDESGRFNNNLKGDDSSGSSSSSSREDDEVQTRRVQLQPKAQEQHQRNPAAALPTSPPPDKQPTVRNTTSEENIGLINPPETAAINTGGHSVQNKHSALQEGKKETQVLQKDEESETDEGTPRPSQTLASKEVDEDSDDDEYVVTEDRTASRGDAENETRSDVIDPAQKRGGTGEDKALPTSAETPRTKESPRTKGEDDSSHDNDDVIQHRGSIRKSPPSAGSDDREAAAQEPKPQNITQTLADGPDSSGIAPTGVPTPADNDSDDDELIVQAQTQQQLNVGSAPNNDDGDDDEFIIEHQQRPTAANGHDDDSDDDEFFVGESETNLAATATAGVSKQSLATDDNEPTSTPHSADAPKPIQNQHQAPQRAVQSRSTLSSSVDDDSDDDEEFVVSGDGGSQQSSTAPSASREGQASPVPPTRTVESRPTTSATSSVTGGPSAPSSGISAAALAAIQAAQREAEAMLREPVGGGMEDGGSRKPKKAKKEKKSKKDGGEKKKKKKKDKLKSKESSVGSSSD